MDWLIEIGKGIGRFFINPLLYCFLIITFVASLARIKQERNTFGSKVFNVFVETKHTWGISLISGLALSIIIIGLGVVINYAFIFLLTLITIILTVSKKFTWLSASYTFGFTAIILFYISWIEYDFASAHWTVSWLENIKMIEIGSIAIIIENRGKWIGQHRMKKITVIPFFTLLPEGTIHPFADWWPVIVINESSFGLILLPVIIGFEHVIRGTIPKRGFRSLGQSLLILGLVIVGLAIAGLYVGILSIIAIIVALVGREWISYHHRAKDQQKQPYFTPDPTGLKVLGIIPGTPADRLGLLVGEKIIKVNGHPIGNEQEFYQALQTNSAFCKLDIRDERGELRFAQRALYQGEHHELGILFAKEQL